ncbi:Derlin-1 [Holothuria leucospilota]|uniref:Derlin n=1 Tax=Holothuria leucospilota TaxID=206669 RepID=A0A9Q1HCP7_HOLLE|nr:Derlin-1 [Holothuria leucospilota]
MVMPFWLHSIINNFLSIYFRGLAELLGILVGHLYFFLMFKYPQDFGGRALLKTPEILYHYFPNRQGGISGFGQAPASRRRPDDNAGGGGRHHWGQGNVLGGGQ